MKNRYQETQSYSRRNCLILECIQLLKTGETLSNDLRYKIDRIDAGTFIFCDCKVQTFKNGKIIIDFANPELFAEFKKRYEAGVKLAEKQYKTYV